MSPEIVKQTLCTEKRSSLIRVCLPRTFEIKDLEILLEIAPNLNHVCIEQINRKKIKVRNTKKYFFHLKVIYY